MKILDIPKEEAADGYILCLNIIELRTRDIVFKPEDYFVVKPGFKFIFKMDGLYLEREEE